MLSLYIDGLVRRALLRYYRPDPWPSWLYVDRSMIFSKGFVSQKHSLTEREIRTFWGLITEKSRCMLLHAKLLEEVYHEAYLASAYILNRTPRKSSNWESPVVAIQRLTKQKVTWKVSHLEVFGCKSYALLKEKDNPLRSERMKPRALVGYLVGYDSTNICW